MQNSYTIFLQRQLNFSHFNDRVSIDGAKLSSLIKKDTLTSLLDIVQIIISMTCKYKYYVLSCNRTIHIQSPNFFTR